MAPPVTTRKPAVSDSRGAGKKWKAPDVVVLRDIDLERVVLTGETDGKILFGSDCAGIDIAKLALELLGIGNSIVHVFASEIDFATRKVIIASHPDLCVLYGDITTRDNAAVPRVDLYIIGFPCQPFSVQGIHAGIADPQGRGIVVFFALNYIQTKLPTVFILENVEALTHQRFQEELNAILNFLVSLKGPDGTPAYTVSMSVLDTLKVGGLPQSRRRLYITGALSKKSNVHTSWPSEIPCTPIEQILDKHSDKLGTLPVHDYQIHNFTRLVDKLSQHQDIFAKTNMLIAELDCGKTRSPQYGWGYAPCLTRNRSGGGGFWIFAKHRFMTLNELERLQGIPPGRINYENACSPRQYAQMIGNAFSVSVVGRLTRNLLVQAGFFKRLADPWRRGSSSA
ncbi:unnamed protein product [Prorocentrum cordatum]|uniref:tRNA (cytosine(38)-C(5))-methyltransferase n=1 Tax=Prorocentrum cordatum TaxID=2364126 RepID=A0ABN9P8C4_9DINO|nr:unnamed protein product [Polarella glacialis]